MSPVLTLLVMAPLVVYAVRQFMHPDARAARAHRRRLRNSRKGSR